MQINKIQQNTPSFKAQLNITGVHKFDKQSISKLKSIAQNIGNKKDILTIHSGEEILAPYGGQCFAPSYSILPIDLMYKTDSFQKVAKFGLNLCEKGNPDCGLQQILKYMTKIKNYNIEELFNNLDSKLFRLGSFR